MNVSVYQRVSILFLCMIAIAACGDTLSSDSIGEQIQRASVSAITFGTRCQDNFEEGWLTNLPNAYAMCSSFNSNMEDIHTKKYYKTITATSRPYVEDTYDHLNGGADTVDMLFMATHGGTYSGGFDQSTYDKLKVIQSHNMRLGDDAQNLSIFATYSCDTMSTTTPDRDAMVDRWRPVFQGGLRYALGGHGLLWFYGNAIKMRRIGRRFADDMNAGATLKSAWSVNILGRSTKSAVQHPGVLTSGATVSDAINRRDHMTLGNFRNYARLRDSSINGWAWSRWNSLD